MWRVLTGRHNKITLSFLLVGHTKFAPDWSFSLLKHQFHREVVSSQENLAAVVEASAEHNKAQIAGKENGSAVIPVHDWTTLMKPQFHQIWWHEKVPSFHSVSQLTWEGDLELFGDSEETLKILKEDWNQAPHLLPAIIPPPGLLVERQWYLYDNIQQFCAPQTRDIVCLLPLTQRCEDGHPDSPPPPPLPSSSLLSTSPSLSMRQLAKRSRQCSVCVVRLATMLEDNDSLPRSPFSFYFYETAFVKARFFSKPTRLRNCPPPLPPFFPPSLPPSLVPKSQK